MSDYEFYSPEPLVDMKIYVIFYLKKILNM